MLSPLLNCWFDIEQQLLEYATSFKVQLLTKE